MATKKVNIDIVAKDKSKQALKSVRSSLDGVKKSIFNVRNAFIGLGAGLAIKSLVNTGKEIESLQVRLKFLFGTAEEGAKAFDNMAKFASKVPFSLQEIQAGSGVLAVVSKDADELAKNMELTGNVAAVTGLDFRTTAEQIQRSLSAGISAADLFRERGVKAMLGFKAGATVSIEETREAFERVFGSGGQFAGATDELAKTFEGTLSMIGDKIFNFKRTVLDKGFFPELKKQFKDLDNFLANQSDSLDKIAEKIGKGLAIALRNVGDALIFLKENGDAVVLTLQGMIALKVASVFYGMTTALAGLTAGMKLFNFATKKNIIFGSVMVFASALGFMINKFKEFKGELVETTKTTTQLEKEIEDVERKLNRGLNVKNLTIQLNLLKQELATLRGEEARLNTIHTAHMRVTNKVTEATQELANTYDFLTRSVGISMSPWQQSAKSLALNTSMLSHNNKEIKQNISATEIMAKKAEQVPPILQKQFHAFRSIRDIMKDVVIETDNVQTRFGSFKEGFKNAMDTDIFEKFEEIGTKTFNNLTGMLTDFVATGKLNFEDFSRTVIRMITEALIGQAVQFAISKSVELFKASAIREGLIAVYKGALKTFSSIPFPFNIVAVGGAIASGMALVNQIKGFEKGGRPPVGRPSLVGEAGPELFVPNSAGTIVPNNQLGGGQPVNVNFNINTVDARGFNELLVNSRGVIVNMINSAVNEKGRQAII